MVQSIIDDKSLQELLLAYSDVAEKIDLGKLKSNCIDFEEVEKAREELKIRVNDFIEQPSDDTFQLFWNCEYLTSIDTLTHATHIIEKYTIETLIPIINDIVNSDQYKESWEETVPQQVVFKEIWSKLKNQPIYSLSAEAALGYLGIGQVETYEEYLNKFIDFIDTYRQIIDKASATKYPIEIEIDQLFRFINQASYHDFADTDAAGLNDVLMQKLYKIKNQIDAYKLVITSALSDSISSYIKARHSKDPVQWNEEYKWTVLPEIQSQFFRGKLNEANIIDRISELQSANPTDGVIVNWNELEKLKIFAKEYPEDLVYAINELLDEKKPIWYRVDTFIDRITAKKSQYSISLELISLILALFVNGKYPLYKASTWQIIIAMAKKPTWGSYSNGTQYAIYRDICEQMGKYLLSSHLIKPISSSNGAVRPGANALDGQDYFYYIDAYMGVGAQYAISNEELIEDKGIEKEPEPQPQEPETIDEVPKPASEPAELTATAEVELDKQQIASKKNSNKEIVNSSELPEVLDETNEASDLKIHSSARKIFSPDSFKLLMEIPSKYKYDHRQIWVKNIENIVKYPMHDLMHSVSRQIKTKNLLNIDKHNIITTPVLKNIFGQTINAKYFTRLLQYGDVNNTKLNFNIFTNSKMVAFGVEIPLLQDMKQVYASRLRAFSERIMEYIPRSFFRDYLFYSINDEGAVEFYSVNNISQLIMLFDKYNLYIGKAYKPEKFLKLKSKIDTVIAEAFRQLTPIYMALNFDEPLWRLREFNSRTKRPIRKKYNSKYASVKRFEELNKLGLVNNYLVYGAYGTNPGLIARECANVLAKKSNQLSIWSSNSNTQSSLIEKKFSASGTRSVIADGILKRLYLKALANPSSNYVIVIDNYNSDETGKIFEDLAPLVNGERESTLQLSGELIRRPNNLYVIGVIKPGTNIIRDQWNDAWAAVETEVEYSYLHQWLLKNDSKINPKIIINLLKKLNKNIRKISSSDTDAIGHQYFMVKGLDKKSIEAVINYRIRPIVTIICTNDSNQATELLEDFSSIDD